MSRVVNTGSVSPARTNRLRPGIKRCSEYSIHKPALDRTIRFLALGLSMVINVFNPACVFLFGRLFDARQGLFDELTERTVEYSLSPSASRCKIVRARGSKRQGAIAAIIDHLFSTIGPRIT